MELMQLLHQMSNQELRVLDQCFTNLKLVEAEQEQEETFLIHQALQTELYLLQQQEDQVVADILVLQTILKNSRDMMEEQEITLITTQEGAEAQEQSDRLIQVAEQEE